MYMVVNRLTGTVVAICNTVQGARRARDRWDIKQGSAAHAVRKNVLK